MQNELLNKVTEEKKIAENAPEDYVFALDIGTRSVIGIVGVMEDEMLRVKAIESAEHTKRAMIDGQIEDIEQVSKVAKTVKERLEQHLGYRLKHVCVAAAGRALKTQKASYELDLKETQAIDQELVCRLEAGAIETAERQFDPGKDEESQHVFYLVGYSVIQYYLDDYPISNLLDHRGQNVRVEVIATFLPREVVDSLYTTMHKIGLEISSLTLEPIAAMNVAIPQDLRLLNLALVDIGAGTSDIAVSKDGGVVGYTMATIAGDEVTETIIKKYLVSFMTAEEIKLSLCENRDICFKDILGFEHSITAQEVQEIVNPVMRTLSSEIAERITAVNGGPTSAVFLVGGGSKLPGLCGCVAEYMQLDANRVAVGGSNFTMHVSSPEYDVTGPEFATPLGIAISAAMNMINESFSITLNGNTAKLFRSGKLSVLDVLMMNGYNYNQFISRSGQSVIVEVNGEKKIFYGGHPNVAAILINGKEASISAIVQAGDDIQFTSAVPGEDAQPLLKDAVGFEGFGTITFEGTEIPIGTRAEVNGMVAQPEQKLKHRDKIQTYQIVTLGDLARELDLDTGRTLLIDDQPADLDERLTDGDSIIYAADDSEPSPEPVSYQQPEVDIQQFILHPATTPASVTPAVPQETQEPADEQSAAQIRITLNGSPMVLKPKADKLPYVFMDMLNYVDIDPTKPQGEIVLQVNGKNASYLQNLADGDAVDIYWKKRTFNKSDF